MTSRITGKTMRQLTIVLGIIGTVAAVAGIWSYFATWLNILGVLVPPIGVIIIFDQFVFSSPRAPAGSGLYWKPFAAWAIGAAVALLTGSTTTPTDYEAEQPALSGESV
jgi:cytosine permease